MSATAAGPTTPPAILPLLRENLPLADLAPYPHAVTWALIWREGRNGKPGAWTKVPKDPRAGRNARSNDPATWGWPDDVLSLFDRFGYMVWTDDPFTFVDLDDAIDRLTGAIKPWAQRIVNRLPGAYWEYSTTGGGLKGLIRARPPRNRIVTVDDGRLEIFFSHKFTVMTGRRLPGASPTIGEGQAALDALYRDLCGPDSAPLPPEAITPSGGAPLTDDEVIARAGAARNGHKFTMLFDRGDTSAYDHDHSRADQALLSLLSFWATDPGQLDRLMRRSALCRPKWLARPDYRQRTLRKALTSGGVYASRPERASGARPLRVVPPIRGSRPIIDLSREEARHAG